MAIVAALAIGFGGGVAYSIAMLGDGTAAQSASPAPAAPNAGLQETAESAGPAEGDGGAQAGSEAVAGPDPGTGDAAAAAAEAASEPPGGFDLQIDLAGRAYLGGEDAAVTVIEMTDYECPFCRRHRQGVLGDLIELYGDRIRYYALNFPLTSIHPLALGAAEAAECAHDQGRFWDYSNALFDASDRLTQAVLVSIAGDLGLDVPTFSGCLTSASKRGLVISDLREGERLGVEGTPTFFINGTVVTGARALEVFQGVIDAELAAAGG